LKNLEKLKRSVCGRLRFGPDTDPFSNLFMRSTTFNPYPVSVRARDVATEEVSPGGGVETFDQPEAIRINRARMAHLTSLGLSLEGKRVLDVGCGVGHLAKYFVNSGCEVICTDGRQENIVSLRSRYPNLVAHVVNVEREPLSQFGAFDIVFCYGLLYHLENPIAALRNMATVCKELLLLETMVCDSALPILRINDESKEFNQGLQGLGCRPSPSFIVLAVNRLGFKFAYAPKQPPEHQDFRFEWRNDLDTWRDGHPLRCIFVASRTMLSNPNLCGLLA